MSADNYGVIHRHGDGWGLSMGFASDDEPCDLSRPYFTAPTPTEVENVAMREYFEYGFSYDESARAEHRAPYPALVERLWNELVGEWPTNKVQGHLATLPEDEYDALMAAL